MDFSSQIKTLFKPAERPHSPTAELSIRTGKASTDKDFKWLDINIPCQKACPAETDIPAYLTAIAQGDPETAYRINLRDNVFPAVLGRVCSRPCETVCRHGYEGLGDPVSICFSKRSADELGKQEPVLLDPWFPPSSKTVAIVGSGVAGLTAARNLTLLGHKVTVYEKHSSPGGMLNQGIPEFRLPRHIIGREIGQIEALGVDIICNASIGPDLPLSGLLKSFDAVVIATGTIRPNLPDLPGIRHGLDFLREVNETGRADIGKRVIVIGGGFTAMDCARTARRLGAQTAEWNLKVLYRRTREVMRVTPGELAELDAEGIPLQCRATPLNYLEKDGWIAGMRFLRTGTDKEFDVPADTILFATGQSADQTWGNDFNGPYSQKLFAAGDYAQGATSLIEAIAHAKGMVEKIDLFLTGEARLVRSVRIEDVRETGRTHEMDTLPRQPMPSLHISERHLSDEVELGYGKDAAIREAERCYRCHYKFEIDQDKCIKCDWCLKAKPRPECILMLKSIDHDGEGRAIKWDVADSVREMNLIWINQDECTRCGACIKACPVDAINLQKVSLCTGPAIDNTALNMEKRT
jgi:formate dehydrogenase major subunit